MEAIYKEIICRHGAPEQMVSDGEFNFRSPEIINFFEEFSIGATFSRREHQQGNGSAERFMRFLRPVLAITCRDDPRDWDKHLPGVAAAYLMQKVQATGYSPFELNTGRVPVNPFDRIRLITGDEPVGQVRPAVYLLKLKERLQLATEAARRVQNTVWTKAQAKLDQGRKVKQFAIGDKVKKWSFAITSLGVPAKQKAKWTYPWTVTQHDPLRNNYWVTKGTKTKTVHARHLKPWKERMRKDPKTGSEEATGDCYEEAPLGTPWWCQRIPPALDPANPENGEEIGRARTSEGEDGFDTEGNSEEEPDVFFAVGQQVIVRNWQAEFRDRWMVARVVSKQLDTDPPTVTLHLCNSYDNALTDLKEVQFAPAYRSKKDGKDVFTWGQKGGQAYVYDKFLLTEILTSGWEAPQVTKGRDGRIPAHILDQLSHNGDVAWNRQQESLRLGVLRDQLAQPEVTPEQRKDWTQHGGPGTWPAWGSRK
jgi:hypothetical protein